MFSPNQYLDYSPELRIALTQNKPVVALESTIISHGMPYPDNVRIAAEVEAIIRDKGATPATIGIISGRIKIGLSADELEFFGQSTAIEKVSRRDLAQIISSKKNGATTVSGTMFCSQLAGIPIFVTGGIGGVHRGVEQNWDISADLNELINTNVAVICAGVKSILDIPKTLEYLETGGVPVITYRSHSFPAFFTRNSGCQGDFCLENPEEIAELLKTKWQLGLQGGVVIGNPLPKIFALPEQEINQAIENALLQAKENGITGKKITPFLLGKIKEITGGKSLLANEALIKNNAALGAEIAIAYQRLISE